MSLINQMLKDLEERSAPQLNEHAETIKGVSWTAVNKPASKRRHLFAISMISILGTGIAVAGYYHLSSSPTEHADQIIEVTNPPIVARPQNDLASFAVEVPEQQPIVPVTSMVAEEARVSADSQQATTKHDADARKMLAALMASGALAEKKPSVEKVVTKAPAVKQPVQLAATEADQKIEKKLKLKKTLRPLGDKKLAEIAYQQGYELIASGQRAAAEKKLQRALELVNTHTRAREMLAVLYLQQQRVAESATILQEGMKILPAYLPFREIYARTLMVQNQLPQAIAMLNKDAPDLKQQPNYHALLAGLYEKNQQHELAASTYLKLVKRNPQQSQWWLGMAISLEKMQKNAEAMSAYKKARELKLPARLMKYVDSRLQQLGTNHGAK